MSDSNSGVAEIGQAIIADNAHNNHCTADPIFLVQQKRRIYGMSPEYTDDALWCREDDSEVVADDTTAERLETLRAAGRIGDEGHGWRRVYYLETWEFVQPFFTRQAAQDYIDCNPHHLTVPRVYVSSAYRNPEWRLLRSYFASMAEQPSTPKKGVLVALDTLREREGQPARDDVVDLSSASDLLSFAGGIIENAAEDPEALLDELEAAFEDDGTAGSGLEPGEAAVLVVKLLKAFGSYEAIEGSR